MLILAGCNCWHLLTITGAASFLRDRFHARGRALLEGEDTGLRRVAKQLAGAQHFTAMGYFPISRATLQGMAATAATYLIILVQFKSGTPVTPS
jgi:hypothetical protein